MHALVTIVVPFDSNCCGDVDAQLDKFSNPAARFLADKLDALGIVHFLSITVVRSADSSPARMVIELTADGAETSAISSLVRRDRRLSIGCVENCGNRRLRIRRSASSSSLGAPRWARVGSARRGSSMTARRE